MIKGFINKLLGRNAGQDLADWQLQYDALFAHMPVGVSFLTADMRYIRINPYLEKKIGRSTAEVKGLYCYDVVGMYKEDPGRKGPERICDVCGVRTAMESCRPYKFTRKVSDNLIVDNMGIPVMSRDGKLLGAAEIILDVTERAVLEERLQEYASDLEKAVGEKTRELRKSRSFLDNIIQSTGDAIFTIDEDTRIRFMNSAAENILDRPSGSLLDKPLTEFTDAPGKRRVEDALERAARQGRTVYNVRVMVDSRDGGHRVLLMSFAPLGYQEGPHLFVCICKDITREARLEQEREEIIAMLTHDLKTPITSVIGYSSLVLNGDLGKVGEELEMSVRGIRTNAQKMLGLVSNFLSAGRMEQKGMPLTKSLVRLDEKVRECMLSMQPMFDDKKVSVTAEIEPGMPALMADNEQVERVIYNLMSNAVRFTPRDGVITVRVYFSGDGYVVLEVSDTGPGVPELDAPHLFKKYFRGSAGNGSGGTGLGLYIAKSIVESHNGDIALLSGGAPGATFQVRLPVES